MHAPKIPINLSLYFLLLSFSTLESGDSESVKMIRNVYNTLKTYKLKMQLLDINFFVKKSQKRGRL